jgi:L-serine dehydratase
LKYRSVFDIIGPVMIGPSSSHTAGAARIGRVARVLFGRAPERIDITFFGSFAKTHKGHGTDIAIVGGVLGFDTSDKRIVDSLEIARRSGVSVVFHIDEEEEITHPNMARIKLQDKEESLEITGISIGGGKIEITEINGFTVKLSGNSPALLVLHKDRFGMIASVSNVLTRWQMNIAAMEVARKSKGSEALMVIETDQDLPEDAVREIEAIPHVLKASLLSL